jgi:hypothetical protein
MYQESAGSENAKVNVSFDGTLVGSELEVTSTDSSNPTIHVIEATGLPTANAANPPSTAIKFWLANEYYVDADTDRNAYVTNIEYSPKMAGFSDWTPPVAAGYYARPTSGGRPVAISDENTDPMYGEYLLHDSDNSVSGFDMAESTWTVSDWLPVLSDQGITFTLKLKENADDRHA